MISNQEAEELAIDGAPFDDADLEDGPGLALPDSIDEGALLAGLNRDLIRGEHAKSVLAEAQMRRVIEASQSLGDAGFVDGLGQLIARVPASVFHHWGGLYGYEIWNNPNDLIRYLNRLNPGFMVKSRGKTQLVMPGQRADAGRVAA